MISFLNHADTGIQIHVELIPGGRLSITLLDTDALKLSAKFCNVTDTPPVP